MYFVDPWRGKGGANPGGVGNFGFLDVDFESLAPDCGSGLTPRATVSPTSTT